MEEQRLLVAHEEVIELHVELRDVHGKPEQVGSDLIDGSHGMGSCGRWRFERNAQGKASFPGSPAGPVLCFANATSIHFR
jgi:hypothetical protein